MRITADSATKTVSYSKKSEKVVFEIDHHELIDIVTELIGDVKSEYGNDSETTDLLIRELLNFHSSVKIFCLESGKSKREIR